MYWIGQIFGILSAVICAITPMLKRKWQMLTATLLVNLCTALNVICIGQIGPACLLCFLACIQTVFSMVHLRQGVESSHREKVVFLILFIVVGLLGLVTAPEFVWEINRRNLIELLPICGALMSMRFIFVPDEQKARKYLLMTSCIWAVYMLLVRSTAFFAQLISMLTALAAIFRYRKQTA